MEEFRTYRVRHREWQALAINVSARSADEACDVARLIRGSELGQRHFEEIGGAIEGFEAEEIDARDRAGEGAAS
jgi:hypothetical protein